MTRTRSLSSIFSNNGHNQIVNRPYCSQFVSIRFYLIECTYRFVSRKRINWLRSHLEHSTAVFAEEPGRPIPPGTGSLFLQETLRAGGIQLSFLPFHVTAPPQRGMLFEQNRTDWRILTICLLLNLMNLQTQSETRFRCILSLIRSHML